jgi:hypothetical protein
MSPPHLRADGVLRPYVEVPTTSLEAYRLGLDVGRRREDPALTTFAALVSWRDGRDDFTLAELITSFHTGWFTASSRWFDRDGEGGDR